MRIDRGEAAAAVTAGTLRGLCGAFAAPFARVHAAWLACLSVRDKLDVSS